MFGRVIVTLVVVLLVSLVAAICLAQDAPAEPTMGEKIADVVETGVEVAKPWLPQPWGMILTAVAGLVIGLLRAGHNRKAGRELAASVAPAVIAASVANPHYPKRLAATQSAAVKAIVDEMQGKKIKLPF